MSPRGTNTIRLVMWWSYNHEWIIWITQKGKGWWALGWGQSVFIAEHSLANIRIILTAISCVRIGQPGKRDKFNEDVYEFGVLRDLPTPLIVPSPIGNVREIKFASALIPPQQPKWNFTYSIPQMYCLIFHKKKSASFLFSMFTFFKMFFYFPKKCICDGKL